MRPISKNSNMKLVDRFRSPMGVTSLIFGLLSLGCIPITLKWSFDAAGEATMYIGVVGLFALLFSLVGLIMGLLDVKNDNTPTDLAKVARNINLLDLLAWGAMLGWGIYTMM